MNPYRCRLQLSIYRLALERAFGRTVGDCQAYFVQHAEEKGLMRIDPFTAAEVRRVIQVAERIAAQDLAVLAFWRQLPIWRRNWVLPSKRFAEGM